MPPQHPGLAEALREILRRDSRFPPEAYEFVSLSYHYTMKLLGRAAAAEKENVPERHVTGRDLLEGCRALAVREFGLMARTVFRCWGIKTTDDVGHIVYNLIEVGLMNKSDDDSLQDFHDQFQWEEAFRATEEIKLEGTE